MDCLNRRYHFKFFKDCFLNFIWSILGYFDPYNIDIFYKQHIVNKAPSLRRGEVAQILNNYNLKINILCNS